jgi:hypothetical protein
MISLPFHWLWEMTQMPAYREMQGATWSATAVRCLEASLGDVAVTASIVWVTMVVAREPGLGRAALMQLLALATAVAIERLALAAGRWSYSSRMVVVPGLGVGLWPLLQMAMLPPLSSAASSRFLGPISVRRGCWPWR